MRGFSSSYRAVRVSRETGMEVSVIPNVINGGSITRNIDTAEYESGDVDIVGALDVGADLVRLYHDITHWDGTTESYPIATMLPNVPSKELRGPLATSGVKLSGRLSELAEDEYEYPVIIPAGANAVEEARAIAVGAGLEVVADQSDWTLSADWVVGMGGEADEPTDKLGVVNRLLSIAGFASARTDPYGRVVMARYRDPSEQSPVVTFREGEEATFLNDAKVERDKSSVANVVIVVYSTQDDEVRGVAYDDNPLSPYSTVTTGRRKTARYEYSDLATQEQANAKAEELLRTQQSVIHRVTLSHVYEPAIACGDPVGLEWATHGISGTFTVRTQKVEMGAGCITESELRRFERGY